MPLGTPSYAPSRLVPFLEGLLPDRAEVREAWARRFGVSPRNAFALLSYVGRDCAGAVEFVARDQLDFGTDTSPLSDDQIGQRLRDLARDPVGWQVAGERWSLAGAQSKFTLARLPSGDWSELTVHALDAHH